MSASSPARPEKALLKAGAKAPPAGMRKTSGLLSRMATDYNVWNNFKLKLSGGNMASGTRAQILARLREKAARKEPIIGGGAGTGISAKCEEAGGIDLMVIYNSGRYRMAGRGSMAGLLAYGNANEIVLEMAREVIPVVKHTPVLAGVNGTDPFVHWPQFFDQIRAAGFAGIQNFPTVGLMDGVFRANLEETGMSYSLEVDVVRMAHERDLLTTPYVFSAENAVDMTRAGADIIVCHLGLTTSGSIGAQTALTLEQCVPLIDDWAAAARKVREDVLVLCHGGPIAMPEDAAYILRHCKNINGFYGASSMERLPTEKAIKAQVEEFMKLTF
ncbi:phosphoenolpyruvate hydrolase family protein [Desulfovibrio sp. OttesenSCG-928-C14]|nr:phosphoenolpyruvate hydrolase family protein [Desulfovibrio sp. OttesenSCG-928-C14]